MNKLLKIITVAGAFAASSAQAIPLQLEITQLDWFNPVNGSNIVYSGDDGIAGNEAISWGVPVSQKQSGYELDVYKSTFDVTSDQSFLLGDFTHHNYVMKRGTSIYEASLKMDVTVSTPSIQDTINLSFLFDHTETTNNCSSSPTCSNDLIKVVSNANNQFSFNNTLYEFEILGFMTNGVLSDIFSTVENQSSVAALVGRVNTVSVSEPSSVGIFSLGLAALLLARRKSLKWG
ncbi:THxN family PEP-CTERM protein [Alkalimarinus sediminis]|uniref:THxN family PEP-CTERM protein n=1 Tax=Alkalimarinus sediminis TaxID=1632866 RepID=A0A9E8HPB3_9ALTE|nr:THxN family PEP-CTERM protein [Alkalimarinus sediminis]UZW76636.1 THxN family PEP-CTERM protein [Alkalimarinus sediminis]